MKFRYAHASHADWKTATEVALVDLAKPTRLPASLGFVYFTESFVPYAAEILLLLKTHSGVTDWVGSVGVGICATGTEYLDEPAIVLMIGDFPRASFAVFSGQAPIKLMGASNSAPWFGIVHGDPATPDVDELIADMSKKVQSGYLAGGLSSARGATVQIANQVFGGGLSGVVFDQSIDIATRLTQGVAPVGATLLKRGGTRRTITSAERNIIVTLDDRPALDVMLEDCGLSMKTLRQRAREVFIALPVVGSEGALGAGDYLVRNLLGIDPLQKLIAIGEVPQTGAGMMFCMRDATSARNDLISMIYDLKDDLTAPPKAALYYACVARGQNMFGEQHAELKLIREHLGDIPLVGFFAAGEIARDQLYGYTGVLTVFK